MSAKVTMSSAVVLQCDECGRRFQNPGADADLICPDCGSEKCSAVTIWGGSVEYALADRGQGYALEDIRFGKLAQWTELISVKQYTDAINLQREQLGRPGRIRSLADILLDQGILNKKEVEAILAARVEAWRDDADDQFGKMAMEKSLLTTPQYMKAREIQLDLSAKGREAPPLPLVLYEKRFMQENAIIAILKLQEQQKRGLATRIRQSLARRGPSVAEVLLGRKGSPARRSRLAVAGIAIVTILVVSWQFGLLGSTINVETMCVSCGARAASPETSKWPLKCRSCGKATVWAEAVCLKCGKVYAVERSDPWELGVQCPACSASERKLVTKDVNVEEIQKALGGKVKTDEKGKSVKELDQSLEGNQR